MSGEDEDRRAAQDFAFNYLSYRSRSRQEVYERLRRKGYPEALAREVVEYLTERRYLDDRKFAQQWADFLVSRKLIGRILLTQELRLKGISVDIIEEVVQKTYEPLGREKELARQLLQKRIRRYRGKEKERLMRSLVNLLARHGFSWSIIKEVIKEFKINGEKSKDEKNWRSWLRNDWNSDL